MSEFRYIIRFQGKDLDGRKKVIQGLSQLKGVGLNLATYLVSALKIDADLRMGALSTDQTSKIEESLKDLSKLGFPSWSFNRSKDLATGTGIHLIASDLAFSIKNDIDRERNLNSWRGVRHTYGLKVRGQRTRCTGRKGRSVGVKKTTLREQAKAKEATAKES
ncbi:MAG: 30S ribosomal protein S13 [Nitrosopumilus sp.]